MYATSPTDDSQKFAIGRARGACGSGTLQKQAQPSHGVSNPLADLPARFQFLKRGESKPASKFRLMIRKLKSGSYRLYSRKLNPATRRRRNLGTFTTLKAAKQHEREVQY